MKVIFPKFLCAGILVLGTLFVSGCISVSAHKLKREEVTSRVPPTPPKEIRVLTINVWSGLTYKGFFKMGEYQDHPEKRYQFLISEIRKIHPDIIAIQEANPLPYYAKRLAKDLNYEVIYSVALGGIRFGSFGIPINMREGQAILVKKPWTVEALGKKRLGGQGIATNFLCLHFGEITQTLLGRVVIHGRPLYVYNVHLHAGPFWGTVLEAVLSRLAQEMATEKVAEAKKAVEKDIERRSGEITKLIKFVEETLPPGMSAIILGDFNTTQGSGELGPLLAGSEWVDSFRLKNPQEEGMTWDPTDNPNFRQIERTSNPYDVLYAYHRLHPSRIDFVLINENIPKEHILESRVVLTPLDGISPSDHYGVLTLLEWENLKVKLTP